MYLLDSSSTDVYRSYLLVFVGQLLRNTKVNSHYYIRYKTRSSICFNLKHDWQKVKNIPYCGHLVWQWQRLVSLGWSYWCSSKLLVCDQLQVNNFYNSVFLQLCSGNGKQILPFYRALCILFWLCYPFQFLATVCFTSFCHLLEFTQIPSYFSLFLSISLCFTLLCVQSDSNSSFTMGISLIIRNRA